MRPESPPLTQKSPLGRRSASPAGRPEGAGPRLRRELLGPQLWDLWSETGPSSTDTVLPRQSVLFLHRALEGMRASYEKLEEIKAASAQSYAVLTETHKRRRAVMA